MYLYHITMEPVMSCKERSLAKEWGRDHHLADYEGAKFHVPGIKTAEDKEKQEKLIVQWHTDRMNMIKTMHVTGCTAVHVPKSVSSGATMEIILIEGSRKRRFRFVEEVCDAADCVVLDD